MKSSLRMVFLASGITLSVLACTKNPDSSPHPSLSDKPTARNPEEVIARLDEPVSDVKSRKSEELIWQVATDQMGLARRDALKTGKNSSGTVRFSDSTILKVGESTLIIIDDRKKIQEVEESTVSLPVGKVAAQMSRAYDHPVELTIKTRKGWIKASNRGLKAARQSEVRFEASVGRAGGVKIINKGVALELMAKGVKKTIPSKQTLTLPAAADEPALDDGALERLVASDFTDLPTVPSAQWRGIQVVINESKPNSGKDLFLISEPKNKVIISSESLQITGILTGRLKAFLNNHPITPDSNGKFDLHEKLDLGANLFTFQVIGPTEKEVRYETLEVIRK